jgi:hypothetical protein
MGIGHGFWAQLWVYWNPQGEDAYFHIAFASLRKSRIEFPKQDADFIALEYHLRNGLEISVAAPLRGFIDIPPL